MKVARFLLTFGLAVVFPVRDLLLHCDHLHQAEHQLYTHPSRRPYAEVHIQPLRVLRPFHHIEPGRTVLYHLPMQARIVCRPFQLSL